MRGTPAGLLLPAGLLRPVVPEAQGAVRPRASVPCGAPQVLACFSSTIFWFLVTTFSDPGILPRNTDSPGARGPAPPLYRERIDDDGAIVTDTWCASNPTLTLGASPAAP